MPIDPEEEDVFVLSDGQKKVSKHYNTLRHYIHVGVFNKTTEKTTKLESFLLPEGEATSVQAYDRFIRRINGWPVEGDDD